MNANEILRSLQLRQLHHDMKAHQDVLYLPLPERMTHFALHLAKYSGRLAHKDMSANLERTAVDAVIVCLAASNALKVQITSHFKETLLFEHHSLKSLGLALSDQENTTDIADCYFRQLALAAGELATACEYLHHIEAAPHRKLMVDSLARACRSSITTFSTLPTDLETAVARKWEQIEKTLP